MVVSQKTGTDNRASTVEALQQSGVDKHDIPAFPGGGSDFFPSPG
ncbi:MAG: hypothetical protein ACREV8_17360 [Gammaproteobacteria bacterium]